MASSSAADQGLQQLLQVHGGYGYVREFDVEHLRQARPRRSARGRARSSTGHRRRPRGLKASCRRRISRTVCPRRSTLILLRWEPAVQRPRHTLAYRRNIDTRDHLHGVSELVGSRGKEMPCTLTLLPPVRAGRVSARAVQAHDRHETHDVPARYRDLPSNAANERRIDPPASTPCRRSAGRNGRRSRKALPPPPPVRSGGAEAPSHLRVGRRRCEFDDVGRILVPMALRGTRR